VDSADKLDLRAIAHTARTSSRGCSSPLAGACTSRTARSAGRVSAGVWPVWASPQR